MIQRDWQKDMDLVQGTIKHDAFPAWTEPMLYWLQEAKERGERERKLKKTLERIAEATEDVFTKDAARHILSTLYPDTPAPKEGE
jgi:hypothetical protein